MKFKISLIAISLAFFSPLSAAAATLTDGVYNVTGYNDADTDPRGIWSPGLVAGSASNVLWSITNSTFLLSGSGAVGQLVGQANSIDDPNLGFTFDIGFVAATGSNLGYCQFDGTPDPDCDNAYSTNLINTNQVDPAEWDYFDVVTGSSSFTGTGLMEGLSYAIEDKSGHSPQFGFSANALELGDLGMSMWFNFTKSGTATNASSYTFADMGRGDFNVDLAYDPDTGINEVPLPASAWLMLGAIGGLAVARRKNKTT